MPVGWTPLLLGSTTEGLPSWLLSSPVKGMHPTLPWGPLPVPSKPLSESTWTPPVALVLPASLGPSGTCAGKEMQELRGSQFHGAHTGLWHWMSQ